MINEPEFRELLTSQQTTGNSPFREVVVLGLTVQWGWAGNGSDNLSVTSCGRDNVAAELSTKSAYRSSASSCAASLCSRHSVSSNMPVTSALHINTTDNCCFVQVFANFEQILIDYVYLKTKHEKS